MHQKSFSWHNARGKQGETSFNGVKRRVLFPGEQQKGGACRDQFSEDIIAMASLPKTVHVPREEGEGFTHGSTSAASSPYESNFFLP